MGRRRHVTLGTLKSAALLSALVVATPGEAKVSQIVSQDCEACLAANALPETRHQGRSESTDLRAGVRIAQTWTPSTGYVTSPPTPEAGEDPLQPSDNTSDSLDANDPSAQPPATDVEIIFWNSVKDSNDADSIQAYLDRYPNGEFAVLARLKLKALGVTVPEQPTGSDNTAAVAPGPASSVPESATLTRRVKLGAIPSNYGAQASTVDGQPKAWLGTRTQYVDQTTAEILGRPSPGGAMITELVAGGPASRADLQPGDVVTSVDGRKVQSAHELARIVRSYREGDEVAIEIWRIGSGSKDMTGHLRRQADTEKAEAKYMFARLSNLGHVVPKDQPLAARMMRELSEAGYSGAMRDLGFMLYYGNGTAKNVTESATWFRKSAEAGDVTAMETVAALYESGTGIKEDKGEALRWSRQAADKGNASAMARVGRFYHNGISVKKDTAEAARWYRKAVDGGDASAMNNLAVLLYDGDGVAKDRAEAVRLYKRAADLGNTTAMGNMAVRYDQGDGVTQDRAEAVRLAYTALERGDTFFLKNFTDTARHWSKDFLKAFQRRLKDAGYYTGAIDGKFGPGFRRAVNTLAAQSGTAQP